MNHHTMLGIVSTSLGLVVALGPTSSAAVKTWTGAAGTLSWHSCSPCNLFETFATSNWTAPCASFPDQYACINHLALPGSSDDVLLDASAPSTVWLETGICCTTNINSLVVGSDRVLRLYGGIGNPPMTTNSLDVHGSILFDQGATYGVTMTVGSGGTTNTGTLRPLTGDDWDGYGHNLLGALTNYGTIDGHSGFLNIEGPLITQAGGSIEGRGIQVTGPVGSRFLVMGGEVADSVNIASRTLEVQNGTIGRAHVNSDTLLLTGAATFRRTNFYGNRLGVLANGGFGKIYLLADGLDVAHQASTGCTLTVWNRSVDLVNSIPASSPVEIVTTSGFSASLNAANGTQNAGLLRFAGAGTIAPVLSLAGTFTNASGGVIRSDVPLADVRNGTMINEGLIEVPPAQKLLVYSPTLVMNGGAIVAAADSAAGASAFRMQNGTTFVYNGGTADTVTLAGGSGADVRAGAGPGALYVFNRNATFVQNQSPLVSWLLGTSGAGTATLTVAAGAENRGRLHIMSRGTNDPIINLLGGFTNHDTLRNDVLAQITGGTMTNSGTVVVAPAARLLVHSPTFNMEGGTILAGADAVNGASTFRMQSGTTFLYTGGRADTVSFTTGSSADVRAGAGPGALAVFNRNVTLLRNESPTVTMLLGTGGTGTATLTVSAGATNRGRIAFNARGTQNPVLSFAGAFTNSAEGVISSEVNAGDFAGTGTLTNSGTLKTDNATAELRAGSRLGNYASGALTGGRYDLMGKLRITGAAITSLAAEVLLRGPGAGVLNQTNGASALSALATVRPQGALSLLSGHRFGTTVATLSDSGLIEIAEACTLQVASGTGALVVDAAGELRGAGRVLANVTNRGTAAPGAPAGRLTVQGSYSQPAAGRLVVEIGGADAGTGFDVLAITGSAGLDGTLEVRFVNGYAPAPGTVFDFLTASSVAGQFATLTVVGGQGEIVYAPGKVSFVSGTTVAVPPPAPAPERVAERFGIRSVMPNPSHNSSLIRYGLPLAGPVRLEIYDATGRCVRTLVDGVLESGLHEMLWNGREVGGFAVPPGVYFARLRATGQVSSWKLMLLR